MRIPTQPGHGGLRTDQKNSGLTLLAAVAALLILLPGCSSKKNPTGGPGQMGGPGSMMNEETMGNKSSLESNKFGTLGKATSGPLSDIHFDYDDYTVRPQDSEILRHNAEWILAHPKVRIQIEGHCDERGSEEYNIALGAKRAQATKDYLVTLGVPAARMSTISYGKELPVCTEHTSSCWAENRRAHFVILE